MQMTGWILHALAGPDRMRLINLQQALKSKIKFEQHMI